MWSERIKVLWTIYDCTMLHIVQSYERIEVLWATYDCAMCNVVQSYEKFLATLKVLLDQISVHLSCSVNPINPSLKMIAINASEMSYCYFISKSFIFCNLHFPQTSQYSCKLCFSWYIWILVTVRQNMQHFIVVHIRTS